ncbi:MAG TPA: large conductance mechanosensitive channel protein MscL [Acidimicrobiales bacterium]
MLKEFKEFISRGNVIDLAVAVIIGAAFAKIVDALVSGLITPLIGMIFGKDYSKMTFTLNSSEFRYGLVVNAALQFLFVAAAVFFLIVKPMNVLAERRRRGVVEEEALSDEVILLTEIRDLLRSGSGTSRGSAG